MTALPPEPPPEPAVLPDERMVPIIKDIGAMVLAAASVVGLLYAGFATSFEAGVGVLSLFGFAGATFLGYRDPRDDDPRHHARRR
jgi:hypothetical protein